jgi:ribosomal protein L34E
MESSTVHEPPPQVVEALPDDMVAALRSPSGVYPGFGDSAGRTAERERYHGPRQLWHTPAYIIASARDYEGQMSSQDEVVVAVEELVTAVAVARVALRKSENSLRHFLKCVAGGETVESVMRHTPAAPKLAECREAMEEVSRTRHIARQRVFAHLSEHGVSVSEMARAWGISRQLASRNLNETTAESSVSGIEADRITDAPVVQQAEALLDGVVSNEDRMI